MVYLDVWQIQDMCILFKLQFRWHHWSVHWACQHVAVSSWRDAVVNYQLWNE